MNKKFLCILSLCFVIFCLTACTKEPKQTDTLSNIIKRGKIIVGVKYDARPFGYLGKNGVPEGFDVDFAKQIAESILGDENKIEFKPVTSSNRILKLNRGDVDMLIATMTITKQRQSVVKFSDPYYFTGQSILVLKNSKISTISDLNGKKVIVVFGSTAEHNIRLLAPNAKIVGFKTYLSGFNALKLGMADAMVSDESILLGFSQNNKSVKLLPQKYTLEPYAVAFKKSPYSQNLVSKVNFIIADMKLNGKFNRLKRKWLKK